MADEDIYATLLLTDTYLPGALVLAHSLRDARTSKQLAVLVTQDSVSVEVIGILKGVYDHVIPVPRIRNAFPANLSLMNRTDLHSAFTKINLWRQTQFRKIVYIDADVVAYRAPDELFQLSQPFSAAPDIGWPDLFNTGVMVLTPSMSEYYALLALAERGISFDGADQGLLNMHYGNHYNRISFTYNVTPSAHYQYLPAYRHFQSRINMVHFIGPDKPWLRGRHASTGSSVFDDMTGRWWAVYDRHYRAASPGCAEAALRLLQFFTKDEFRPRQLQGAFALETGESGEHEAEAFTVQLKQFRGDSPSNKPEHRSVIFSDWDPQRHPPPVDSKPEAANLPRTTYAMSDDPSPFVPPERYPTPPRNMWFQVPREKPTEEPKPIFPWEKKQPKPSRVFADYSYRRQEAVRSPGSWKVETAQTPTSQEERPATPSIRITPSNPWTNFTRSNVWDDVPGIERYVETLQKHQRTTSIKSPGEVATEEREWRRPGLRLTDFPTEFERPSLPVTPAPIRRPNFWGGTGEGEEEQGVLPAAEGVPPQTDWDPVIQLQKLAKHQSEALLHKLGSGTGGSDGTGGSGRDGDGAIPSRTLPGGEEDLARRACVARTTRNASPQPVNGGASTGERHRTGTDDDTMPRPSQAAQLGPAIEFTPIAQPSYSGPGAAFEKGEDYAHHGTPLPPSEEERDVLET